MSHPVTSGKTVLILGGGVGGLAAARRLARELPAPHRVVLVDRSSQHTFAASYPWVMMGWRRPAQIRGDLRRLVGPAVQVVTAEVQELDLAQRVVRTSGGDIPFGYLIVAVGADLAPEALPGFAAAHSVYDLEGAARLREALAGFSGGRVAVVIASLPFKCPAAPYEAALLLDSLFRRNGRRRGVDIQVYTPEGQPMPVAGPAMGQAVQELLAERGIGFHPSLRLAAIDGEGRHLVFEGGRQETFDLVIGIPPHRGPAVVREAGLANEAGWVPADPYTLATGHDGVYALGDVAAIPLPGRHHPDVPLMLPKAGVFAHAQGEAVAANILTELQGRPRAASFEGRGFCWIELGGGKAAFADGDFYARPAPTVDLRAPGSVWHWGKVLFERYWLSGGLARPAWRVLLRLGSKALGVSGDL